MKGVMVVVSVAGLLLTVVPAFLVLHGTLSWEAHARLMFLGMLLWFGSAPFTLWKSSKER